MLELPCCHILSSLTPYLPSFLLSCISRILRLSSPTRLSLIPLIPCFHKTEPVYINLFTSSIVCSFIFITFCFLHCLYSAGFTKSVTSHFFLLQTIILLRLTLTVSFQLIHIVLNSHSNFCKSSLFREVGPVSSENSNVFTFHL